MHFPLLAVSRLLALALPLVLLACDRNDAQKVAGGEKAASSAQAPAPSQQFEAPPGIEVRAAGRDLTGRFTQSPAVVSSPCGFFLVASGKDWSIIALLPGEKIEWSPDPNDRVLRVDGIHFQPGLVQASDMGHADKTGADLLILHGQWETEWLRKEAGARKLDTEEKAQGRAARNPRIPWLAWQVSFPQATGTAGVTASEVVIGSAAVGATLFSLRALLTDEAQATKALKRTVFAIDSLEFREEGLRQEEFLKRIKKDAQDDPQCSAVLERHAAQLQ